MLLATEDSSSLFGHILDFLLFIETCVEKKNGSKDFGIMSRCEPKLSYLEIML